MTMVYIAEHFISIQGEGSRTGIPSLFIRNFGCNLGGCLGFGQKDPSNPDTYEKVEFSEEHLQFSPKYGCDSPKAVQPCFKKFCTPYENGKDFFIHLGSKYNYKAFNEIVITGGEPMLFQDFYLEFLKALKENMKTRIFLDDSIKNITIETNGTIPIKPELKDFIYQNKDRFRILISTSPKLNCVAGVDEHISINYSVLEDFLKERKERDLWDLQIKFVYNGTEKAYNKVLEIYKNLKAKNLKLDAKDILLMPVGAWSQEPELRKETAKVCSSTGFRYCNRLHIEIFGKINGV